MQVLDHVLANNYPRVGKRGWLEGMPLEPCPASEITFVVCEASEVGAGRTVEDRIYLSRKPSPSKVSKSREPPWALTGAPGHCPL